MTTASRSFLVLAFILLLVSSQTFAQRGRPNRPPVPIPTPVPVPVPGPSIPMPSEVISEEVRTSLRPRQILRVSSLLRLDPWEASGMEVQSITILAQSYRGRAELTVQSFGSPLATSQRLKPQLTQITVPLSLRTQLEGLELVASDEVHIESISLHVLRRHRPIPGPGPGHEIPVGPQQLITLQVHRQIRGSGEIPLKQLVKQQLGLSLQGAEIERIVVIGQPLHGRHASVQVELNNRIATQLDYLSPGQRRNPLRLQTNEPVRGNLRLHVQGDALIEEVLIRVGQVRNGPQWPGDSRILINQEISAGRPLELGRLVPHEQRTVTAITVEAQTRFSQAELALVGLRGDVLGSVIVGQVPMRGTRIQLLRPMSLRELRLQSWSPIIVESLELEFDHFVIGHL